MFFPSHDLETISPDFAMSFPWLSQPLFVNLLQHDARREVYFQCSLGASDVTQWTLRECVYTRTKKMRSHRVFILGVLSNNVESWSQNVPCFQYRETCNQSTTLSPSKFTLSDSFAKIQFSPFLDLDFVKSFQEFSATLEFDIRATGFTVALDTFRESTMEMANEPFMTDFPYKTSIQFGDSAASHVWWNQGTAQNAKQWVDHLSCWLTGYWWYWPCVLPTTTKTQEY